jgi:S1-C subfamily serine protease
MKRVLAIAAGAAVLGGLAGAVIGLALDNGDTASAAPAGTVQTIPSAGAAAPGVLTPEQIYAQDASSVVVITDTQTQQTPPSVLGPSQPEQVRALGSGFVIDDHGDIVTNAHVVANATSIRVGFNGGASYKATLVGADPSTDIAVVRVSAPASALHPLVFADSGSVRVGDPVYAIGNPFGLDRTMTAGIVSAVARDIQAPNGLTIADVIQTDAPINHGNSGGPLLDRNGRVVGVNAQIEGGTVDANVGVGFAVPSNTARGVARELIADGKVEHAFLGVRLATIDPAVAGLVRDLPSHGAVVTLVVKGSPAAEAGLRAATQAVTVAGESVPVGGDTIVSLNGTQIDSASQVADTVALGKPGDTLHLVVVRGGTSRQVDVTLGALPAGHA